MIPRITIFLLSLFVFAPLVHSQDLGQIRNQMAERLPAIDDLKEDGLIGESKDGLLSIRGSISPEQRKMVEAENKDRMTVYNAIAKQTGQPVSKVQEQRAAQLAKTSAPGVWLQDAKGNWYQKK
tara:strand:+ start:9618 stop:9989 length:372 start_codon:yes stop_codon:yes gene_type:complete